VDDHTAKTLVAMARRLYPHDFLAHAHYARVVEIIARESNSERKALLRAGVTALDGVFDCCFLDLPEEAQVEALTKVEKMPFFEDVRAKTVRHLYSNPDIWAHFGYEGPSAHLGGYIKRGFDDIPWIPDDEPIDE
jgi:hypothetical protein